MSREQAQAYLDEMVRQRGYVLEYHKPVSYTHLTLPTTPYV